ncbi:hypothetical protein EYB26_003925 [Talaromyces marneffei]|uniref:uncharacterized protein n=1 Tax=Talaromyces marneffei TaxID=37727 RepID=UPI0012A8C704|nr:uncharacterized protein EYB26_003925 [Talaromyces marneffei]QGA16258.1 hypothetical protein EYB26_003925 [Talaromyces marneffei]
MSASPFLHTTHSNDLSSLGLGAETNQYDYQGVNHFLAVLDHENNLFATDTTGTKSQYFVLCNLNEQRFNRDFCNSARNTLTFESYIPGLQLLLVKMSEYEPHSVAARSFEKQLNFQLNAMDQADKGLMLLGTAHFQPSESDRKKRVDDAYRPKRMPRNRRKSSWPSLTVEVGFSEPVRKLNSDAIWWITQSRGHVNNVIRISINRNYRQITIEKWANIAAVPDVDPAVTYRNVLSQEAGAKKIKFSNKEPLIITFDDLFLRSAQGQEADITFDTDILEAIASDVWYAQFEMNYHHQHL